MMSNNTGQQPGNQNGQAGGQSQNQFQSSMQNMPYFIQGGGMQQQQPQQFQNVQMNQQSMGQMNWNPQQSGNCMNQNNGGNQFNMNWQQNNQQGGGDQGLQQMPNNMNLPNMPQGGVQNTLLNCPANVNQQTIQAQTALFWNAFRASQGQIGNAGNNNMQEQINNNMMNGQNWMLIQQQGNPQGQSFPGGNSDGNFNQSQGFNQMMVQNQVNQMQMNQLHANMQNQMQQGGQQNLMQMSGQQNQMQMSGPQNQMQPSGQQNQMQTSSAPLQNGTQSNSNGQQQQASAPMDNFSRNSFVSNNVQNNGGGNVNMNQSQGSQQAMGSGNNMVIGNPNMPTNPTQQQLLQQLIQNQQLLNNGNGGANANGMAGNMSEHLKQFQAMQQQLQNTQGSGAMQQPLQSNQSSTGGGGDQGQGQRQGSGPCSSAQPESSQSNQGQMQQFQGMASPTPQGSNNRTSSTKTSSTTSQRSYTSKSESAIANIPTPDPIVTGGTVHSASIPATAVRGGTIQPNGEIQGEIVNVQVQGICVQKNPAAMQQAENQRCLDGNFAGGWQSNADVPDRKRIILSIIKIVERMRPDSNNRLTSELPLMAKKLEEHLYRSAHTKQEYLDLASLKRRLHLIAEGVGVPRQPSRSQAAASTPVLSGQNMMGQNVIQPQNSMGLNQSAMQVQNGMDLSGMQPQNSMSQNVMQPQNAISQNSMQPQNGMGQSGMNQHAIQPQNATQNPIQPLSATGSQGQGPVSFQGPNPQQINSQMIAQLQMQQKQLQQAVQSQSAQIMSNQQQLLSDTPTIPENSPSSNDPASLSDDPKCDKKKIVLHQQQRRLLLLRHSKLCRLSECGTKFCPQMVVLWKHLKHCRGKTCPVPHCVSSRCVLSHHRNCKRRGLSLQCEICSPVTIHARRNGEPDGDSWNDDWDNFTVFDDEDGNGSLLQAGADTIPSNIDMSHPMDQQHSGNGSAANGLPPQIQVPQNQQSTSNAQAIQQDIEKKQTILGQIRHQKQTLFNQNAMLLDQLTASQDQENSTQLQNQINLLQHLNAQFERQETFLEREINRQTQALQQLGVTVQQGQPVSAPAAQSLQSLPAPQSCTSLPSNGTAAKPAKRRTSKAKKTKSPKDQDCFSESMPPLPPLPALPSMDASFPAALTSNAATASASRKRSVSKKSSCKDDADAPLRKSFKQDASTLASENAASAVDIEDAKSQQEPSFQNDAAFTVSSQADQSERNTRIVSGVLASMPVAAIEQHLDSLINRSQLAPRTISRKCLPVIKKLIRHEHGWVFKDPVDPVELGLDDYFQIVEQPMDLGLVEQKLDGCVYKDLETFERDTKLVFTNAILFNGEDNEIGRWARQLLDIFNEDLKTIMKGFGITSKADAIEACKNDATCSLCGKFRLLFEAPALYCREVCCLQKIRRNMHYYTDQYKSNQWCDKCYAGLKEDNIIQLDDGKETKKSLLVRLKNDLTPEEQWVQCDDCHECCHQVCALFNGSRGNSGNTFSCPKCIVAKSKERQGKQDNASLSSFKDAKALPECNLSKSIECGLSQTLTEEYEKIAIERECDVSQVEKADGLCVRVVMSLEKNHKVREGMLSRYSGKGFPSAFPVTSKCILLFQKIHGVDVLLFGMYVYEYGDKCPAPNRRRVYISYLDSVYYLQPSQYRTLTYQSIIVEYLRFVRSRGFHTAHIWSCPPCKGDEYIFYCHPNQQLVPKDEMLCAWYVETLKKAQAKGIVLETRTIYDEYFKDNGINPETGEPFDPRSIPYFDGDYIPGEIEKIISALDKDETLKEGGKQSNANSKSNSKGQKIEGKRRGTRSNPGDLVNQDRDKVMNRLDLALARMKQNFFVAQLLSDDYIKAVEIGVDVSAWEEDLDSNPLKKPSKQIGKNPDLLDVRHTETAHGKSKLAPASNSQVIGNTIDEDPFMEQECLDTRIAFLNFCQKKYYQFDQLRRAKYSTLMLLSELHNPRELQFKVHMQVIAHAALCPGCQSKNCTRMQQLFEHVRKCDITYRNGCKVCIRLFMLLTKHARNCDVQGVCPIPFCERIRERHRRMLRQQQLLDDRRRDEQNNRHQEQIS